MTRTVAPGPRTGAVQIPASKSQAHRMLICAALSKAPSRLVLDGFSADIEATVQCLEALGAQLTQETAGLLITPIGARPANAKLDVGESGSTLRFLLPVLGALGIRAEIQMHGRLPERPLSPLWEVLEAHGMQLRQDGAVLHTDGQLCAGDYSLPGNVSSQFISGLLFALPLLNENSTLTVTGALQSARYVAMTEQALAAAGIFTKKDGQVWQIDGGQRYAAPAVQTVEGDWSNAAFFLCMGALSATGVTVAGLNPASLQADRAITEILTRFGAELTVSGQTVTVRRGALHGITLDAGPIPDLIPVVSCLAALCEGETRIINAARLRLKESDRRHGRLRLRGSGHGTGKRMRREVLSRVLGGFCFFEGGCSMSSVYTGNLTVSIFGQSHAPAIGVTVDGLPAGLPVDPDELQRFLSRRAPGQNAWSTPRREADAPEFLCGLKNGKTCGAPLTAIIRNTNTRSGDYENLKDIPRPGHADYTAQVKFGGAQDVSGGGHFSGRLTAPLCIAGGVCMQLLEREGISIRARILSIGHAMDSAPFDAPVAEKPFPAVSDDAAAAMQAEIAQAKADGDSVGGVVECVIDGLPAGIGEPMFGGLENLIARAVFAIPAIKGVEFGAGFAAARLRGSEHNDAFRVQDGRIVTETNRCGGILGGISTGMPVVFRTAFKPTPSISRQQDSVSLSRMENTTLVIHGRHDPCIVPRAVPCVEAAAAIAVLDAWMGRKKELGYAF